MASFNSKQYSWCSISVLLGGRILDGCTAIEYTEKKEKELLYGRGCKPHGVVGGNDIVVAYVPNDGGQIVTDILKGVEFTEVKKGMNQGDKNMIVELPILFIDVKRQQ